MQFRDIIKIITWKISGIAHEAGIRFMRTFIVALCLGLALVPAISQQTVKKAPAGNKKTASAQPPIPKTAKTATSQPAKKNAAASSTKIPNSKKPAAIRSQTTTAKSKPKTPTPTTSAKTSAPKSTTSAAKTRPKQKPSPVKEPPANDKTEFEKAAALTDANEKIAALKKFIAAFPDSTLLSQAREQLSSTAYSAAEKYLSENDAASAISMYKLAVDSAPTPISEKLFDDSLSKIPNALYWRGNRIEALDIAKALETKSGTNTNQLIVLAMFHVLIEDGEDAVRVAEIAAKADQTSAKAFQTLGLAHRVNFQLEESAAAYAKALELEPSNANRRNLAEIKRAVGKADEAVSLFREILTADPTDVPARNGLVMSLFDAGKKDEAETELAKALEQDPKNVMLLGGAAYWYAANKNADKAVELALKAISAEPRYVWSHLALARGLMLQNKPLAAEEVLLKAKVFGNFPTIEYELASARCMAGFYREAVEGLQKSFEVTDDSVVTRIGGRIERKNADFTGLLADERRASTLEPLAADDGDTAAHLKSLLSLTAALAADKPDETAIAKAADAFVSGDDKYKLHRQLYAASILLSKRVAPQKALDYATAAMGGAETALDVPNASAAVMASELYDSRQAAFAHSELVQVPNVPRQMLSTILRGRIEELAGWALLQQDKPAEAMIRFRRAVTIFPDKSAWWRSSMWRLGSALQASGKDPEALDAYIKSYSIDKPDLVRYTIVEALYKKLNGSTDGLEGKIGRSPIAQIPPAEVAKNIVPTGEGSSTVAVAVAPSPTPAPETLPAAATATPVPLPSTEPSATPAPPSPDATPQPSPSPSPEATPSPAQATPTPTATPQPEITPSPSPTPTTAATPMTLSETKTQASPEATPTPNEIKLDVPTEAAKSDVTNSKTDAPSKPETSPETSSPTKAESTPEVVITASPTPTPKSTPPAEIVAAKTDSVPGPLPAEKQMLVSENPPADKSSGTNTTGSKSKPLFEPIIIKIPKPDVAKPVNSTGEGRARVIDGLPIQPVDLPPCTITVSQEKVSLINSGGSISVLVGVSGEGDLRAVRAVSSSPDDISVTFDPSVRGIEGRRLYVIKSLTENTGMFQIKFQLPCGKKDISVTVR